MSIEAFTWLVGNWRGVVDSDAIDELWSAPAGGALMGMFRWLKGETLYLYEFMTIAPLDQSPDSPLVLRLKHFDAALVGREEKDQSTLFELVSNGDQQVLFENRKNERRFQLRYQRQGSTLTVTTILYQDSAVHETNFTYQRVD